MTKWLIARLVLLPVLLPVMLHPAIARADDEPTPPS